MSQLCVMGGWVIQITFDRLPNLLSCSYCLHTSVDASEEVRMAKLIYSLLNKTVDEVGERNVVQWSYFKAERNLLMKNTAFILTPLCSALHSQRWILE